MRLLCLLLLCWQAYALEQPAPGVYVHYGEHKDLNTGYGGDICNSGFIVGSKGVAVIDPGGSIATGRRLREEIAKVTRLYPLLEWE